MKLGLASRLPSTLTLGVFAFVLIVLLWAAVGYRLVVERANALEEASTSSRYSAELYEQHVAAILQQIDQATRFVRYEFEHPRPGMTPSQILQSEAFKQRDMSLAVVITSADGQVLAWSHGVSDANLADRPFFKFHRDHNTSELLISPPVVSRVSKRPVVPVTRRLNQTDGNFAGVVAAAVEPDNLAGFYDPAALHGNGMVALVGEDGVLLSKRVGSDVSFGGRLPRAFVERLSGAIEGSFASETVLDGQARAVSFHQVDGYPLYAVVGIDENDALMAYHHLRNNFLGFASAFTLIVLLFATLLAIQRSREESATRMAKDAQSALRAAIEGSLDAFYLLDPVRDAQGMVVDFRFVDGNEHAATLLGLKQPEFRGTRMLEQRPAMRATGLFERYVKALDAHSTIEEELEVPWGAGHGTWIHHQLIPVEGRLAVTARDVTHRRRSQDATRADQIFLQSLFDNVPLLISVRGARGVDQGRLKTWNRAAEILTGYPAEKVMGKTMREVVGAERAALFEEQERELLNNPMIIDTPEHVYVRADGNVRYFHTLSVPVFGHSDEVEYILRISEDVTRRREQEKAHADLAAQMQAVIDASPLGLFRTDVDRNLTYINAAFERITGIARAEATGQRFLKSFAVNDAQRFVAQWDELHRSRSAVLATLRYLRPNRDMQWLNIRIAPVVVGGEVTGFVGTVDDITARRAADEAQRRLAAILEATSDIVVISDADGHVSYLNPAGRRMRGMAQDTELSDLNLADLFPAATLETLFAKAWPQAAASGTWVGETALVDGHGATIAVSHLIIGHRDATGQLESVSSVMRDLREMQRIDTELRQAASRLRILMDSLPILVSYFDAGERYRFVNHAYEVRFTRPRESFYGVTMRDLRGEAAYRRYQPYVERALRGESVVFEEEDRLQGRQSWYEVSYIPHVDESTSTVLGFFAMVQDITETKLSEKHLRKLSEVDALTQLANRAAFEKRLPEAMDYSRRNQAWIALLYLDIDHFKFVNDSFGHQAGDALLKAFAERLKSCFRKSDTVARLGGDEFTVIAESVNAPEQADAIAQKILRKIHEPFSLDKRRIDITASVGIALYRGEELSPTELVRRADAMLYEAKSAGRNTYRITRGDAVSESIQISV